MACRRQMPDVILLDWQMPQMNGVDFLKALRSETRGNHPVVLFCTTENDVSHISEAIGAGADEYIMKPYDRGMLEAKLAEVGLV
jgi:two-component system chemotaxis response regulator CheY